jgi:hypothetical protein
MLSVQGNQDDPKRRFNRSTDNPVGARDLKLERIDVDKAVKSTAVLAVAPGPVAPWISSSRRRSHRSPSAAHRDRSCGAGLHRIGYLAAHRQA